MRVKVGALGEMQAEFKELRREGHHLVATLQVPGAMPYEIAGSVSHRELRKIMRAALKGSIISFLLFGFRGSQEPEPSETVDY